MKALAANLDIPLSQMHSVVVFSGDSTFKTSLPENVCTLANFTDYILSFDHVIWTTQELAVICAKMESVRLSNDRKTHQSHVQHLRGKHASK